MSNDATPAKVRLTDGLGPLLEAWAKDEFVQFVSRSHGKQTTTTLSRDCLMLLMERSMAAERERCAKFCEWVASSLERAEEDAQAMSIGAQSCADQIRAGA